MLTGKNLGAAIEAARKLKNVTKKALAEDFGVAAPSIQDWVNRGTIDKEKLPRLWSYFSDVVGPEHWGLAAFPYASIAPPVAHPTSASMPFSAVAAQLATSVSGIPPKRRRAIAQLVAEQIQDGATADDALTLDALAGDITISTGSGWRSAAFSLAESHPDPVERERLTQFIRIVDQFTTAAKAPTSVSATSTEGR